MRLIPLKQWICDSCGKVIERPEDGWFEWYTGIATSLATGFRIVHHQDSCMYDDRELERGGLIPNDHSLPDVLGTDGLGHLLFMLEQSDKGVSRLADVVEFVGMMRRLYLPYWEEARQYWEAARRDVFHDACTFDKDTLRRIIEEYEMGEASGARPPNGLWCQ